MSEVDVALTDFFLTGLCAYLCFRTPSGSRIPLAPLYAALALASFIGGLVHLLSPESLLRPPLWWFALACLGVVAVTAYRCAWAAVFGAANRVFDLALGVGFLVYLMVISFGSQEFEVAVLSYLPAVLLLALAMGFRWVRSRDSRWLLALCGIALTLLAAWVQHAGWELHPVYLSHNALYHLVQAVGLLLLFTASRARYEGSPEGSP